MSSVLRAAGAMIAGMAVAFFLLMAVEFFSSVVHPMPPDFNGTMEEMCEHVARYPQRVLAVVVPMWAAIALISTWIAGRLGNRGCALFVGLLLVAGVAFNVAMLPYPAWFKIVNLLTIPAASFLGLYLSSRCDAPASIPGPT